jgi:hypothetical protein
VEFGADVVGEEAFAVFGREDEVDKSSPGLRCAQPWAGLRRPFGPQEGSTLLGCGAGLGSGGILGRKKAHFQGVVNWLGRKKQEGHSPKGKPFSKISQLTPPS